MRTESRIRWLCVISYVVTGLLSACNPASLVPNVSLRALAVLHQRRPMTGAAGGADVVLLAQLSFASGLRAPRRVAALPLDPATWLDAPVCDDALLCAWLSAAERSTLAAWGAAVSGYSKAWLRLALCAVLVSTASAHAQEAQAASADPLVIAPDFSEITDKPSRYDTQLTQQEFAKLNARYAHEPTASQVVAAALRAQERDPARFAEMTSRARLRALLPNLDLGARRGQGVDLRSTTTDELGVHLTTADDLMLFATLRFELGRLLFAGEEVAIAREERFERQSRNELVRKVVHLYFLRRRLLLERELRSDLSLSRALQVEEIEALLDVFTDGAWQRMMRRPTAVAPPHPNAR